MQSVIKHQMEKEKLQQVDSDDDDEDDDEMDMSENPSGKKLISQIGNERAPEINRIKKIPSSIITNPINHGGMI